MKPLGLQVWAIATMNRSSIYALIFYFFILNFCASVDLSKLIILLRHPYIEMN